MVSTHGRMLPTRTSWCISLEAWNQFLTKLTFRSTEYSMTSNAFTSSIRDRLALDMKWTRKLSSNLDWMDNISWELSTLYITREPCLSSRHSLMCLAISLGKRIGRTLQKIILKYLSNLKGKLSGTIISKSEILSLNTGKSRLSILIWDLIIDKYWPYRITTRMKCKKL